MQKVSRSWPAIHDERIIEKEQNAANHFFRFNERTPEKEAMLGVAKTPQECTEKSDGKPKTQKRKVSKKQK